MNEEHLPAIQDQNLPALPIPHCPVMLILDTSHSMWGRGMQDQQDALKAFHKTLAALEFQNSRIDIAAIGMGDDLRVLQPFTPLAESAVGTMSIRPKGDTPIGGALRLALDELRKWTGELRRQGKGVATPQLLLLSDGESSDDFAAEAAEVGREVASGGLSCSAVALGLHPDMGALARIAGQNVYRPDYGQLRQTFAQIGEKVSQTYEDAVPEILMAEAETAGTESAAPSTTETCHSGRLAGKTILLDGTNICFWGRNDNTASLVPLQTLVQALDAEGADWQACFDASTRHHLAKSGKGEEQLYEEWLRNRPERFAEAPAGSRADVFLLEAAQAEPRAVIISNDRYRDHEERYPFIRDKSRLAVGKVFRRQLCVPDLGIACPVSMPEASSTVEAEIIPDHNPPHSGKSAGGFLI